MNINDHNPLPSRSATEQPPLLAKLRAPVPSASNLRHRALLFAVGLALAVACVVIWWPVIRAVFPARSTPVEIECATVAMIDGKTEVIVCTREAVRRYAPQHHPRIPGREA